MDFYRKLDIVLEQKIPPKKEKEEFEYSFDEDIFSKMANFIVNLDPDKLTDIQLEDVIDMISDIEVEGDDEEAVQEVRNPRMAKRSSAGKNQASKKWYRMNRMHVKKRKKKFMRSSEGRKRLKMKERMERMGKTATGRKKVRYHVRQKDMDKKEEEK